MNKYLFLFKILLNKFFEVLLKNIQSFKSYKCYIFIILEIKWRIFGLFFLFRNSFSIKMIKKLDFRLLYFIMKLKLN